MVENGESMVNSSSMVNNGYYWNLWFIYDGLSMVRLW